MSNGKILVTGCGAITALGDNLNRTWDSLINKKSGISLITSCDVNPFSCRIAAEIKNLKTEIIGSSKELKRHSRSAILAITAAAEAIESSKILYHLKDSSRVGVFWASGNGGISSLDHALIEFARASSKHAFNPFFQSNVLTDSAGARISAKFGFTGPNMTIVSACSSGNVALHVASLYLKAGIIDYAIVGGCEAPITPSVIGGFSSMHALSTKNNNPELACNPFAENRNGFVIGEGAAAMVLEFERTAVSRKSQPKAYFSGAAQSNEANHITLPSENGIPAAETIKKAIQNAGIEPHRIDLISAHGTGTKLGDASEYNAYREVFGENLKYIPVTATKSMTGHLLGASSTLEAVLCIEMLNKQTILPGLNTHPLDKEFLNPRLFIPELAVEMKLGYALNHSSGFGGQNASVIFEAI